MDIIGISLLVGVILITCMILLILRFGCICNKKTHETGYEEL